MNLVRTSACPVCGATEREPADMMSRGGTHYLKHAAALVGMSVDRLIDSAHVFRCLVCQNYFCDPWLSPELASSMFCAGSPDHIAGWAALEAWLYGVPEGEGEARNRRLYDAVRQRIGPLTRYAEFGCPFQGFLLQFRADEMARGQRVSAFARALHRGPDPRWSRLARIHHVAQRCANAVSLAALRLRGLASSAPVRAAGDRALPPERYLLTEDTSKGWGSNCVRYGGSCQYYAHRLLGAHVLPLDEAHRGGTTRFDLVGVFNSLDHSTFPMDVLRRSLDLASHVLVVTHDARHAGKQHLYALSDQFPGWLAGVLPGVTVESLGDEIDRGRPQGYHYVLLSRTRP